jgi:hypothetical protein
MTPTRIEVTLLVVQGFEHEGVEYRAGDRVPIRHRAVRQIALEHRDWFAMEYETVPLDLEWLREVEARQEATYRAAKRTRDEKEAARERALRYELEHQDDRQPELERRLKEQEAERERREQQRREEAERRRIEEEAVPLTSGFHY